MIFKLEQDQRMAAHCGFAELWRVAINPGGQVPRYLRWMMYGPYMPTKRAAIIAFVRCNLGARSFGEDGW